MNESVTIKSEPLDDEIQDKLTRSRDIILREFEIEISEREQEVERIQERIQCVEHYTKVLKYVSSYSYFSADAETTPSDVNEPIVEAAIHPCVKSLLPSQQAIVKAKTVPDHEVAPSKRQEKQECLPSVTETPVSNLKLVRGSYKVRHKLIVGNVSKWISPDIREDDATHKWMVYVRDKEDDEFNRLVKKVRYFLHDSYKPHDVIDVTSSPFHLTRRGWGEFPVRVKIFFQNPINKPIDVVHTIKLDETFSGRQMLGGETLVEVDLFHENIKDLLPQDDPEVCSDRSENCLIATDHDYCLKDISHLKPNSRPQFQPQQISSQLASGVEINEESILDDWDPASQISITSWYHENILNRASDIIFLSTEACVKWFLTKWPIITNSACSSEFKQVHPYSFASFMEFNRSNIGKQRAAEWYLAYKIRAMLEKLNVPLWTTKQIVLYIRMHGYVPIHSVQYNAPSSDKFKNISTYTSFVETSTDLRQIEHQFTTEEVDIVGDTCERIEKLPVKIADKICMVSKWGSYVELVSRQVGARYGEEEITPGCVINGATQIVIRTVQLFLANLLRKSLANAWSRNSLKAPSSLEISDLLKTIVENPEFDILTNAGLGSKSSHSF